MPHPELSPLTAQALYEQAGLVRRRKGQRKVEMVLPLFLFADDLQGHSVEQLGITLGYNESGKQIPYDNLVVTTPDGQRVAAYRRHDPARNFAICQDLNYLVG